MAICKYCDREMTTAQRCIVQADEEKRALRLPFGSERRFREAIEPDERCHDCGVICGELHHPGCDMEECARCAGQRLSCNCPFDPSRSDQATSLVSGLRVLPVYEGWTIDLRCKQFRKVHEDGWIDFLDFDSDEGDELLARFITLGVNLEPTVII